jgi:membrane associated rhomboid family serine protease
VRLCVTHGLVEGDVEGDRCPTCKGATLDPAAPENAKALAASLGVPDKGYKAELLVGLVWIVILPLVGLAYYKSERLGTNVVYALALCLGAFLAVLLRRRRARATGPQSPLFTSTTVLAFTACVVFVGIREAIGIEALWYGRGMAPWRIVTSSLTHGGLLHIFGNMVFLLVFGLTLEARIGRLGTAAVLAASAIAGALVQAQFTDGPMVGFSAAVYGVLGATLAVMPDSPQSLNIKGGVVPMPTWAFMLVIVPAFTLVSALAPTTNVAWIAHLAGFAAGLAVALPMRRIEPSAAFLDKVRAKRERIAAATRHDGAGFGTDITDADVEPSPAVSDPAIRAYLDDARRHRIRVSVIGGGVMLVLGVGIALLAAWLEAPAREAGRRTQSILAGLVMAVSGLLMVMQAIREHRRR